MPIRQVGDDIPASPQISRLGKRDGQGKRRRDRRVDRIAPASQNVAAGVGRMPFLGDHDMLRKRLRCRADRANATISGQQRSQLTTKLGCSHDGFATVSLTGVSGDGRAVLRSDQGKDIRHRDRT